MMQFYMDTYIVMFTLLLASQCGEMDVFNVILAVNGTSMWGRSHFEAVNNGFAFKFLFIYKNIFIIESSQG